MKKLLVIQCAALGHDLVRRFPQLHRDLGLAFQPLTPPFPAVTCTVQATFRTAQPPEEHGVICNGFYFRDLHRTAFWEQSADLLPRRRIWDEFRAQGHRIGAVCWQQSLGGNSDTVLSPAPIHKHEGGMIQDCYSQPPDLYRELSYDIGRFSLHRYWGPLAGIASTRWIVNATSALLHRANRPELLLTYIPHLDYVLQKYGPRNETAVARAVDDFVRELRRLLDSAKAAEYDVLVFGDYAITPAEQAVFPNRMLRDATLFQVRRVKSMTYPDLHASRAFALVDHQVAHLFLRDPRDKDTVRACFAGQPGIAEIADAAARDGSDRWKRYAGDLILTAAPGFWFAYPWWRESCEEPDYAGHVDIHSKPGFDPCELFWGWPPPSVSRDPSKVKGTHGRTDVPAVWAATCELPVPAAAAGGAPLPLADLARAVEIWLG